MFSVPLLSSVTSLLGTTALDDAPDMLSCSVTTIFYVLGALLICARANVGNTIECWFQQTYSGQWEQYAENYCFLKGTYFYPNSHPAMVHVSDEYKREHRLAYYQWSGIYLATCGIFFMLPKFIWRLVQGPMDIPILYLCDTTNKIKELSEQERQAKVDEMAEYLFNKLSAKHSRYSVARVPFYWAYSVVKVCYVVIAIIQFVTMTYFVGQDFNFQWGWELFRNLMSGITWEQTGVFPRITYCDFAVREIAGNLRRETVQCVIGINEFNEKIFLFLWFWLLFLIISVVLSTVFTAMQISKTTFVSTMLWKIRDPSDKRREAQIVAFSNRYLGLDGKILLNFVQMQSDIVAQELAITLFHNFEQQTKIEEKPSAPFAEKAPLYRP